MSRQREWQLKQRAAGCCEQCGKPRDVPGRCCSRCVVRRRELGGNKTLRKCSRCGFLGHYAKTCDAVLP